VNCILGRFVHKRLPLVIFVIERGVMEGSPRKLLLLIFVDMKFGENYNFVLQLLIFIPVV